MRKGELNISPVIFCGLLDNLTKQFFKNGKALCATPEDFSGQLTAEAQKFFSIVVYQANLGRFDVLATLCDDTKNQRGKNTYTIVIFFNSNKFQGVANKINIAVLLSHEICHFAFFYELFLHLGGALSSDVYNKFKNIISRSLPGRLVDSESKINFDKHDLSEIIIIMDIITFIKKFPDEHFTYGIIKTKIDFSAFFRHFLIHKKIIEG